MTQENFTEEIKDAITNNGGQGTDIEFLTDEMLNDFGKQLAAKGIKARIENPAYNVNPVNTVEGIAKSFDWTYDWITPGHCPLKPVPEVAKIIELIKCTPGSTEATLKEIDELGFEPAPSNYVVGLGKDHPDAHKEYKYVVSLDKSNIFANESGDPCFLCLSWDDERGLSMASEAHGWDDEWWFAVVRKSNSVPSNG